MKRKTVEQTSRESNDQALKLHMTISALMREFRLEPGLLAGSPYTSLHANDIGLFEVLTEPGPWSVRGIAKEVKAPISTISSALDRLERAGLVKRIHSAEDRRVVRVELTVRGKRLEDRLGDAHVLNCQNMLLRLTPVERDDFLRLAGKIARKA
jgi:MarR family transcriptional regulator, 2-MHQ and catechol-resistance regulon repressor